MHLNDAHVLPANEGEQEGSDGVAALSAGEEDRKTIQNARKRLKSEKSLPFAVAATQTDENHLVLRVQRVVAVLP